MAQLPSIGEPAPDFTLPSTSGRDVTLSALRGKRVLLAFFPEAFTRVCTAELCAFSEDFDRFREADLEVLPISVDPLERLGEFKAAERLAVDLLSDAGREVSRSYGTLVEERGVSARAYVLIDRNGLVRWAFVEETPGTRRQNSEILARVGGTA